MAGSSVPEGHGNTEALGLGLDLARMKIKGAKGRIQAVRGGKGSRGAVRYKDKDASYGCRKKIGRPRVNHEVKHLALLK